MDVEITYRQQQERLAAEEEARLERAALQANSHLEPEDEDADHEGRELRAYTFEDFLQVKLPAREAILLPWLFSKNLGLLHAFRGTGKTWCALAMAGTISTGSAAFDRWISNQRRRVLYVDGEMPADVMQERLRILARCCGTSPGEYLRILSADACGQEIPDISTREGQHFLDQQIMEAEAEVIFLDNLSCLVRSGVENEAESWRPIQSWLLSLRRRGKTVMMLHHSGKGGLQRGTSKREDVLDVTLKLSRPQDYRQDQGARFEVTFEKARGIHGPGAEPFEAWLRTDEHGTPSWAVRSLDLASEERILALARDGLSSREIAGEVGRHHSTVARTLNRLRGAGRLADEE